MWRRCWLGYPRRDHIDPHDGEVLPVLDRGVGAGGAPAVIGCVQADHVGHAGREGHRRAGAVIRRRGQHEGAAAVDSGADGVLQRRDPRLEAERQADDVDSPVGLGVLYRLLG